MRRLWTLAAILVFSHVLALSTATAADPEAPTKAAKGTPKEKRLSVRGTVVNEKKVAVAGAKVWMKVELNSWSNPEFDSPADSDILATTTTDRNGKFDFRDVVVKKQIWDDIVDWVPPVIVVQSPQGGLAWEYFWGDGTEGQDFVDLVVKPATKIGCSRSDPAEIRRIRAVL